MRLFARRPPRLPECADWIVEGKLAAMCLPSQAELEALKKAGIELVINLTNKPGPTRMAMAVGLVGVHMPLEDGAAPPHDRILEFVSIVSRSIERDRPVAVHCLGGVGRTGTMIACYLVSEGMAPWAAIDEVRTIRPASIGAPGQDRAVVEYARYLRQERKSGA